MIDLYVVHYNQEAIIHLISAYWKLYPLRKVFVFDNMSTDKSLDYIVRTFHNTEIIPNTTPKKDNKVILDWKNNAWKRSSGFVDFVLVCDCDEVLYCKDWDRVLIEMKNGGYSYLRTPPNLCSVVPNGISSIKSALAHEDAEVGFVRDDGSFGKVLLFDPSLISASNYSIGAHTFNPTGVVKEYSGPVEMLHYDYFSADELIARYHRMAERRSAEDVESGCGNHYTLPEDILRNYYQQRVDMARSFDKLAFSSR